MDDSKKKFVVPLADIVDFKNDDIITDSTWDKQDNAEPWGEVTE